MARTYFTAVNRTVATLVPEEAAGVVAVGTAAGGEKEDAR